jgi:hypothetical protein
MGRKLITIIILILSSCSGQITPIWIKNLIETNGNSSIYILIPLENSCGSCQIYLGEWLLENQLNIDQTDIQLILLGKDKFTLQSYVDEYLPTFTNIMYDTELIFLTTSYLEGEYPYFKIKLFEIKENELIQSFSLEPGNQMQISNQLSKFFD